MYTPQVESDGRSAISSTSVLIIVVLLARSGADLVSDVLSLVGVRKTGTLH